VKRGKGGNERGSGEQVKRGRKRRECRGTGEGTKRGRHVRRREKGRGVKRGSKRQGK